MAINYQDATKTKMPVIALLSYKNISNENTCLYK
jgi:hypothetical protein